MMHFDSQNHFYYNDILSIMFRKVSLDIMVKCFHSIAMH